MGSIGSPEPPQPAAIIPKNITSSRFFIAVQISKKRFKVRREPKEKRVSEFTKGLAISHGRQLEHHRPGGVV